MPICAGTLDEESMRARIVVYLESTKYDFFKSSCFLPKFHRLEDMKETGTLFKEEPLVSSFGEVIYTLKNDTIVIAAIDVGY